MPEQQIEAELLEVSSTANTALVAAVVLYLVATGLAAAGMLIAFGLSAALITAALFAIAGAVWCIWVATTFRPELLPPIRGER